MFIPDPDFYPSRISDPGSNSNNNRERWEKIFVLTFFVATMVTKLKKKYFRTTGKKKTNLSQFTKNYSVFYSKKCHKALEITSLGSEIRDPEKHIPDPGSRG
jgi:hypothetical protein